jgi:isochorismate pyruvate lyase
MKKPEECLDMQEIRTQIDVIDKNIIELLGNRFQYVKAASKFKTDENSVKAPERLSAMLVQRRKWAEENCLSPDIIEKMFRDLVGYFIDQEMKHWKNK